ncbi:TetR/AcrR family transcriptional regulator [Glycomyces endophyticus]|uniref:TetR/AcrR family transcriptional regulator n=1 Tax=Glycomyces endophyticus TaxID=480996 RepID=A0ABP4TVQ9_9ACTN
MPRTADHELRRTQMAAAVHRLIAHDGLDAATMAAVAREAGFSVGLVQHYFASKDELLLFAYERLTADLLARVARITAEGEAGGQPIRRILLDCLCELLPLDAGRRGEHRVSRAFQARAMDVPAAATVAAATAAVVRGRVAQGVANGKECGEVEPATDADLAALELTALVDGLADHLYREPAPARSTAAGAVLADRLAAVFPGECRHYV